MKPYLLLAAGFLLGNTTMLFLLAFLAEREHRKRNVAILHILRDAGLKR